MNAFMQESLEPRTPIERPPLEKMPSNYGSGRPIENILEDFYWRGFQDGLQRVSPRPSTNYEETSAKYFEGFKVGQEMRAQVEEIIKKYNISDPHAVNKAMQLAWQEFYRTR